MEPVSRRELDRAGALPLWAQLQDDVLRRVRAGEFDTVFPGELALVDEYGVSRHTVRQALAQLRADGVVTAERGRPPRVAAGRPARNPIEQPVGAVYSLFASVAQAGLVPSSVVRVLCRTADGTVATRLGLEESTPLLHVERVRFAGDEPLALDRVWLPFSEAAPLLEVDLTSTALYTELAARTGLRIDGGRERIRALTATGPQADLLGVEPGAAMFAVERTGSAGARPVEWRHTLVRGDRFTLSAGFGADTDHRLRADDVLHGVR